MAKSFTVYAVNVYRPPGKRKQKPERKIIDIGTITLHDNDTRASGRFHCTPTGSWAWDFFALPFGSPPPGLPKDDGDNTEQTADSEEASGDDAAEEPSEDDDRSGKLSLHHTGQRPDPSQP
jgi:hypothetical protein